LQLLILREEFFVEDVFVRKNHAVFNFLLHTIFGSCQMKTLGVARFLDREQSVSIQGWVHWCGLPPDTLSTLGNV
jgi:hypothetical protein